MDNKKYTVSVVIPVWNNWELSRWCLQSLNEHTFGVSFQVVLVDNGSTDATPVEAPLLGKALFGKSFTYLRLPENQGFAKACNQGARASSSKFVFFLNNDTTVTSGWLDPLLDAMKKDSRLAGVGPLLIFPDESLRGGRVQHLGMAISHGPEFRHLYELFPAFHSAVKKRRKLSVITAAAMLISSRLFQAYDGFFEGFVNGMEDVDFCCRISSCGGYFSVIPDSVVYHHTNQTAGRFAKESENQRLLLSRCRRVEENFCRLIAEDGFEPAFTPWLDLVVRLPKEQTLILEKAYQKDPTPECLNALICTQPLWDRGYIALIREAQAAGDPAKATKVAYLRSLLCPSLSAIYDYASLMEKYGNPDLIKKNVVMVAAIESMLSDHQGLTKKVKSIEKTTQDSAILAALDEWKELI